MTRVFWDTNLFIYLLEGGEFAPAVERLRRRMLERGDLLVTSALALGEVLVRPGATDPGLAARYEASILSTAGILPFDVAAARAYALIRQDRAIKAPDAIHLACAAAAGVDLFITNDDRLSRRTVRGVKFITSLGQAFL